MISYSGRRHSTATTTYRAAEKETTAETEASRRVSLGANLNKRYHQPLNARLSPNSKSKWASDTDIKPAFIVNNPASWRTQPKQLEPKVKKLQPANDRQRRAGVSSQPLVQVEVKEQEQIPTSENEADKGLPSTEPKPEQPSSLEHESDFYDPLSDYWQSNPVQAASWKMLHSDESDFIAWKVQIMNEIKESKANLDQKFEQIATASPEKKAVKKTVRIADPDPKNKQKSHADKLKKATDANESRRITIIFEDPQDENDEEEEVVKQVIPRWKKRPHKNKETLPDSRY